MIDPVQESSEGLYTLTAVNSAGTIATTPISVSVRNPPLILVQPLPFRGYVGDAVTLAVDDVVSDSGVTYAWEVGTMRTKRQVVFLTARTEGRSHACWRN